MGRQVPRTAGALGVAARRAVWSARGTLLLRRAGVAVDGVVFYGLPLIDRLPGSHIRIGKRVVLCSHPAFTALGVSRPVILRTMTPGARIDIGDDVGLSGTVICAATSVRIGSGCLLGADVLVADTDFHPVGHSQRRYAALPEPSAEDAVEIGSNVFLGARSVVMKGVTIGDNTVVGACSVVTRDLPSDVIAAGNPCRVIRSLDTCT